MRIISALLAIGAALALITIALPLASYPTSDTDLQDSETASVTERETDLARDGLLEMQWREGTSYFSPAGVSGTVTEVFISEGDPLECGSPVVEVNGVTLLALCGNRPAWREFDNRTEGADADQILTLLIEGGYVSSEASSSELRAAIRQLQKDIGAKPSGALSASNFVWIGESATPSKVASVTGEQLNSGVELFVTSRRLLSARVDLLPRDEPQLFYLGGSSGPLSLSESGGVEDLRGLEQALEEMGNTEAVESISGIVGLEDPVAALVVPPTSVISGVDGSCVSVITGVGTETVDVKIIDSSVASVFVTGDLLAGSQVQLHPDGSTSC